MSSGSRLGREPLEDVTLVEGTLHAVVPAGLSPGRYDVVGVDPEGEVLTLLSAYQVLALDNAPALVAGYRFRLVDGIENAAALPPLVQQTNRGGSFAVNDLFAELGWSASDRLRLIGGLRLSRLPSSYDYTSDDFLAGTRIEEEVPVDDRNLLTGTRRGPLEPGRAA